jgi:tetratricopeptide (TPR) repeat protein
MMSILLLAVALLQDTPSNPIEKAQELIDQGRGLQALQTLDEASRANPNDAGIHYALGSLYASAGRMAEAIRHIEQSFTLAPDEPSYAFAYGELLYRSGQTEEALAPLRAAEELPEALIVLAAVYEKLGPEEEVFTTLSRYLELKPEDNNTRLLLGQQLEAAKRYDEALAVYRGAPENPMLAYHAADILARDREGYAEAESLVRAVVTSSPDMPDMIEARLLLARILERQERYDAALAELEEAKTLHPDAPQVYFNLTRAYQRAGRPEDAKAAAALFQELDAKEQAASDRDARVAVTYKQAAEALQQGKMSEAESVFRSVLEIDPDHAQTQSMLAKIAFSKGDAVSARRLISDAIGDNGEVGEYHYLLAMFAIKSGAPAEAIPALQRSIELDPAFPDAWSMLGSLLLDSGEAQESVECFLKAAALEPSNATVYLNLASAYAALDKDVEEAAAMDRYRELSQP